MSRWVVVEFVGGPRDGERRVEGWPLRYGFVEVPRPLRAVAMVDGPLPAKLPELVVRGRYRRRDGRRYDIQELPGRRVPDAVATFMLERSRPVEFHWEG